MCRSVRNGWTVHSQTHRNAAIFAGTFSCECKIDWIIMTSCWLLCLLPQKPVCCQKAHKHWVTRHLSWRKHHLLCNHTSKYFQPSSPFSISVSHLISVIVNNNNKSSALGLSVGLALTRAPSSWAKQWHELCSQGCWSRWRRIRGGLARPPGPLPPLD